MEEHERFEHRLERLEKAYAERQDLVGALDRKLTERLTAMDKRLGEEILELKTQIALLNVRSGWTNTLISVLALLLSGLITLVVLKR